MTTPACLDFIEALSRARDLDEVRLVCQAIYRHCGFDPIPGSPTDSPPLDQPHRNDSNPPCPYLASAVARMIALHRQTDASEEVAKPELTRRERECLLWAAEGKTAWEIALILCITERTVNFHLQNAARKLDVVNRQQAIARAVALGLIRPKCS